MVYIILTKKGARIAKDSPKKTKQCGESSRDGEEKGMASNAMP